MKYNIGDAVAFKVFDGLTFGIIVELQPEFWSVIYPKSISYHVRTSDNAPRVTHHLLEEEIIGKLNIPNSIIKALI